MSDRKRPRARPRWFRLENRPQPVNVAGTKSGRYDGDAFGTCFRKAWYPTEFIASEVARRVYRERGVHLRSYECPDCKRWHLTKQMAA